MNTNSDVQDEWVSFQRCSRDHIWIYVLSEENQKSTIHTTAQERAELHVQLLEAKLNEQAEASKQHQQSRTLSHYWDALNIIIPSVTFSAWPKFDETDGPRWGEQPAQIVLFRAGTRNAFWMYCDDSDEIKAPWWIMIETSALYMYVCAASAKAGAAESERPSQCCAGRKGRNLRDQGARHVCC